MQNNSLNLGLFHRIWQWYMNSVNQNFLIPPPTDSSKSKKKWYQKWWGRVIIGFLFIFFTLAAALGFAVFDYVVQLRSGEVTPEELFGERAVPKNNNLNNMATFDDPSVGPRDAKVVIVEFSDFQCPFCGQSAPVIKEILKDYGDKILFVYRDFPVEDLHPQSVLAAMAGECAHEQGKFWEMHDRIFANQANITSANLKTYAIQIGLNSLQFGSCLDSQKYLAEIEEDLQDGFKAGVRATPTFLINGVKVEGALPFNTLEKIILSELSR